MRILYRLTTIYIAYLALCTTLFLSACSTTPPSATTTPLPTKLTAAKNPITVAVYTQPKKLSAIPYKIIGKTSISEYNLGGIKRQEACLNDTLRTLAASMGGDAIIDIIHNNKKVTGTVIAYQPSKKQKMA